VKHAAPASRRRYGRSRPAVTPGQPDPGTPEPPGQSAQESPLDTGSGRERPNRREPADAAADDGQRGGGSQALYWIAACGVLLGLVWLRGGERYARSGTLVLAGVLLAAAVARLVLPDRLIGMLGSRGRLADVAALGALGGGLLVAGLVFPAPP
jgi:Protein of unknown function (DUF3017)